LKELPDEMVYNSTVYVRTKYGSYIDPNDPPMVQQKNALSYEQLKKLGYRPRSGYNDMKRRDKGIVMKKAIVIGRISKRDMKLRQYQKPAKKLTNLQLLQRPFYLPFLSLGTVKSTFPEMR